MQGSRAQTSSPFDSVAGNYDEFENSIITHHIRAVIGKKLLRHFQPGQHILELNCGTGTDAIMLAQRGISVTAFDASAGMIETAKKKVKQYGLEHLVAFRCLDIADLSALQGARFDGAFSNFGGLNCVPSLPAVFENLHSLLRPRAPFLACLINKVCLWEIASFFVRGKFRKGLRRFAREGSRAVIGKETILTYYYSPAEFRAILQPFFVTHAVTGINIFSPPPHSADFVARHTALTQKLLRFDDSISSIAPFHSLGDHFLLETIASAR